MKKSNDWFRKDTRQASEGCSRNFEGSGLGWQVNILHNSNLARVTAVKTINPINSILNVTIAHIHI